MTPKDILLAFSRKQASPEDVMRVLVSHDDWFVPATYATHVLKTNRLERGLVLGDPPNITPGELWFFIDQAAVDKAMAKGAMLGFYASRIPGRRIFAELPTNYNCVRVNPGSDQAETWFIPNDVFALAALWGHALTIETWLTRPDSPEKFAALRDFPAFGYLIDAKLDAIATAVGAEGMKNPGMAFTAPDCINEVLKQAPHFERRGVNGLTLFKTLPALGVDGLIFNYFGPGPMAAFDAETCRRIAQ